MDILWPALVIGAIVLFVLYILASHWQRILRQQSWSLRRLADRVQILEELGDPQFRRRLGESTPVPLDQVFTLSFRLNDHFWRDVLQLREVDWDYVRMFGSFVGSVKLECWRSHTVATITEVLPDTKTARWQTRSLDFYPDAARKADALTLWEIRLNKPDGSSLKPPSLDLVLTQDAVELCGHLMDGSNDRASDVTFFRVPLDTALLAGFRSHDPAETPSNGNGMGSAGADDTTMMHGSAWQACYAHQDEDLGIEWQLRLRDLTKKAEWEKWRVLESTSVPYESNER